ncbi:MAG: N-acetylglucosamine-6-phosphate deacetylase [Armatimonadetes bacterium]|nr:N-acetylglucosamine-6-phosphate deacetylase [Armatimonadota bacterium]
MTYRILAGQAADARGVRQRTVVTIEGGRIAELGTWTADCKAEPNDIEAPDALLVPGFVDIHIHGGGGRYLMEGTTDSLQAVAHHLTHHGVTGFLSTTITAPWQEQTQALAIAAKAMHSPDNGKEGAEVLGVHLEGPYINPIKKGAQPGQFIRPPSIEELARETGEDLHAVKVVTLAPEMEGALELIRWLTQKNIIASIGHTNATYAEIAAAIDAGARHVTHCYNAMRPLDSREPGVVGAAMARTELTAELIWDNHHVHPASCRALIQAKGVEGVILISDGIPGTSMPEGYTFHLGDLPVVVKGGTARLPDGTLAGSLLTLETAFQNATPFTLAQRSAMTSRNAAIALGLGNEKGLISAGYTADLVLLGADGRVQQTFVGGRSVYRA